MKNLKPFFRLIIISTCFLMLILFDTGCAKAETDIAGALPHPLPQIETQNREELLQLIEICAARKESAHLMAEAARALGYDEDHPVIQLARKEWYQAHDLQTYYYKVLESLEPTFWEECAAKYPIATKVWLFLKELGYNNYVCAGIMGNMMAECGGQTLNLDPLAYSPGGTFYGICQWSKLFYPEIHGKTLEEQLDFLKNNIESEFNSFGYAYKSKFKYVDFLALEDAEAAALAFAKAYERCNSGSYGVRQSNAKVAYEYFVTSEEVA